MSRTARSSARADRRPSSAPDSVPVLSRGKHRSPRQGACFMEFASVLAGERWSDRPSCTHPALASLARLVNDRTTDGERSELAPLIPDVIGLRPADPRTDLVIAFRAAAAALPIASEGRQRVLAVGVIRCLQRLRESDPSAPEIAPGGRFERMGRAALDAAPLAEEWALRHIEAIRPPRTRTDSPLCDTVVGVAVAGMAEACVGDPDARLRELLRAGIEECAALSAAEPVGGAVGRTTDRPAARGARQKAGVLA